MIHIKKPFIVTSKKGIRIQAEIITDGVCKVLWFEVEEEYGDYLVDDRADAFVVAYLNYAMTHGHDIKSDAPLTEQLFYQLTNYYIPGLTSSDKRFKEIRLLCATTSKILSNAGAVGTGMSGGIDSFHTIQTHSTSNCLESYKITHLTFFNVGATQSSNTGLFNYEDIIQFEKHEIREHSQEINEQRYKRAKEFADAYSYPLIRIESNLMEVQPIKFLFVHTQRNSAAVLVLQKLFKVYYYASSDTLNSFNIQFEAAPGHYDIFSLAMFSTSTTKFYSSGAACSRVDKTKAISTYPTSYDYLNVCWRDDYNCGMCRKCLRTLVTLDLLDALDKYTKVFDVDKYFENREKHIAKIFAFSSDDPFFAEIVELSRQQSLNIGKPKFISYYLYYYLRILIAKTKVTKLIPETLKSSIRLKLGNPFN